MVGEPLHVHHPGRAAGDHAEPLRPQAHDRQVAAEAAALVEQRGVDDPSHPHVQLSNRDRLHGGERARPDDVEHRERGQVDEPARVTHREVLGVDDR
jgi:hypothetical protein